MWSCAFVSLPLLIIWRVFLANSAPDGIRTHTVRILSPASLPLEYEGKKEKRGCSCLRIRSSWGMALYLSLLPV